MSKWLSSLLLAFLTIAGNGIAADNGLSHEVTQAQEQFVPRAEVHRPQHGNLRLTSVLVAGGAPYPGTRFSIVRDQPDAYGKKLAAEVALVGPESFADFRLDPGSYRVIARNGAVSIEQAIEVPANGTARTDVVLNAGRLKLN